MKLGTPPCFIVPKYNAQMVRALKALEKGTATAYEQQLAMKFILDGLAATYQNTFVPEAPDQSAFMAGRAFVGQQIMKLLRLDPTILVQLDEEEKNGRSNRS